MPKLKLAPLPAGYHYQYHTTIKPVGAKCNLHCQYCFYLDKASLLQQPSQPIMPLAIVEQHIRQYIESQTGPQVVFTWQGGEPTLAGLEFFRNVVALQQRYQKPGQQIANDLQTNGVLLNEAWLQFLKQHNFLLGISLDGPQNLHDHYRTYRNGTGSFAKVMATISKLHHYQIPFNVLTVVNQHNAQQPLAVYRFIRDQVRPRAIQFLPAVEPEQFTTVAPNTWRIDPDAPAIRATPWSVQPEQWGEFLTSIWDEWLHYDLGKVFVDNFENTIGQLLGYPAINCVTNEFCGKALALEHTGDLYSCDRYVYLAYHLGNIAQRHQGNLAFSQQQQKFAFNKKDQLPQWCKKCPHLTICWGECPKNRFSYTKDHEFGLNYLCPGLRIYYRKVKADLGKLRQRLKI